MIKVNGEYVNAVKLDNAIECYKAFWDAVRTKNICSARASAKEKRRLWSAVEENEKAFHAAIAPIDEVIKAVEGRAKERTISAVDLIGSLVSYIDFLNIPLTKMDGIAITIDENSQDKPKAYKYRMMNTIVMVVRNGGHWWLSTVERAENRKHKYSVELPKATRDAIIEHNYTNIDRRNLRV